MKKSASSKAAKTNHQAAVSDLAPKSGQDVRGGLLREATTPAVSEITVSKTQDCSSTS